MWCRFLGGGWNRGVGRKDGQVGMNLGCAEEEVDEAGLR